MKALFKPSSLTLLLLVVAVFFVVKLAWFTIAALWLPKVGVNHQEAYSAQKLYYHMKVTPNERKKPRKKPPVKKKVVVATMKGITLFAIYKENQFTVVTVSYKKKTKILATGEEINGFVLEGADKDEAFFRKDEKRYVLKLLHPKGKKSFSIPKSSPKVKASIAPQEDQIVDAGDHKIIERSVFEHYTQNMDDIYKNVGIVEVKEKGQIVGFKLTFVKKGSLFSKLGVKRGDVLTEVNGEKLNSYNAAFKVYQEMQGTDSITLKIKRGNEEMELEYEIN